MIGPAQGQIGARGPGFLGFVLDFLDIFCYFLDYFDILGHMGAHGPLWARTLGPMGPGPGPWALFGPGQDHGPYGPRAWALYFSAIVPYFFF